MRVKGAGRKTKARREILEEWLGRKGGASLDERASVEDTVADVLFSSTPFPNGLGLCMLWRIRFLTVFIVFKGKGNVMQWLLLNSMTSPQASSSSTPRPDVPWNEATYKWEKMGTYGKIRHQITFKPVSFLAHNVPGTS